MLYYRKNLFSIFLSYRKKKRRWTNFLFYSFYCRWIHIPEVLGTTLVYQSFSFYITRSLWKLYLRIENNSNNQSFCIVILLRERMQLINWQGDHHQKKQNSSNMACLVDDMWGFFSHGVLGGSIIVKEYFLSKNNWRGVFESKIN